MKNNWLGVLLGISCASLSSFAFSLGLGGITTESAINEPLIAEIKLINVGDLENTQILVGIGTDSDYQLAGVTKEFFHSDLQFEVQVEGTSDPRIIVRTRAPLQDPYLNFIVQIRWPQGKLLREYTLLLDMPVFSRQETAATAPRQSEASAPTTARQAVAQQATRQTTQQQQTTQRQTTAPRTSSNVSSGRDYRVSSGDTLWGLAGGVSRSTGISRHQAMLAIHDQNPNAFVNGDINRLKADVVLSVPSESQMSTRTEGQAVRDFSSLAQEAGATPVQSSTDNFRQSAAGDNSSQGGRLALSTSSDLTGGGTTNSDEDNAAAIAERQAENEALTATLSENAALKEQLDAVEVERSELEERISNLEEQISLLQEERALQLENQDLAAVQAAISAEDPAEEEPASAPVAAPTPESETFLDKLNAFRLWIFGGLAIIAVIALLVVLLVLRRRGSSDVEELYYDEDEYEEEDQALSESYEDEAEEEYLDEEDLDEGIDEITNELPEDAEEDQEMDSEDEEEEVDPLVAVASSFEEAEEDVEEEFESGEFEDLDEFFGDDSSDATNVLFGSDEKVDDAAEEGSETALEFSESELDVPEDIGDDEPLEVHDENSLEFEVDELSPDADSEELSVDDDEIDLDDKFGFTEPGITEDLGPEAEAEFEESIEVHSTDMGELLVPDEDDSDTDDDLFVGESPDVADDEDFGEVIDEEPESLLDEDDEDEPSDGSVLDMDEDLNLDEDMDADLGDLDLGEDDLDAADSDEEFLTKLELAEAYIEMGDVQGAKELLSEVEKDGNAEQKAAAKALLEDASG